MHSCNASTSDVDGEAVCCSENENGFTSLPLLKEKECHSRCHGNWKENLWDCCKHQSVNLSKDIIQGENKKLWMRDKVLEGISVRINVLTLWQPPDLQTNLFVFIKTHLLKPNVPWQRHIWNIGVVLPPAGGHHQKTSSKRLKKKRERSPVI